MRLGVAPEEPLALLSDAVVRAGADAVSIEHRIRHFPKRPLCDICNRAKVFSKGFAVVARMTLNQICLQAPNLEKR